MIVIFIRLGVYEMNEVANRIKKIRTWNMVALVLTAIGAVVSLVTLPSSLFPKRENFEVLGKKGLELYNQVSSTSYKVAIIFGVVMTVLFVVLYFIASRQLSQDKVPSKLIYFASLGYFVLNLVIGTFLKGASSANELTSQLGSIGVVVTVVSMIAPLLLYIPQIMCLVHIFAIEKIEEKA